ncbi:esterase-like activity of phytase family protein [Paracoccus spongiarum]|uniref:Esterase-like activity of phytase family protein n=1 Tax=Paracoccus spongiarum TaxID=3064387 RepID=A0ABT9JFC3_9RHOB|nr:esterase-like activity of phytase family protein [Paracoccus sp. 2205BS29-5]MDP5308513.1 esterase-like activity of phytase family protein [Paracoccus sp. 2205BS29-5]
MPKRRRRALIAALSTCLAAVGAAAPAATLDYVGTYVWRGDEPSFGGFSGIEISADGRGFHVLSDRAWLYWGSIDRDEQGRLRGMNIAGRAHLKDSKGEPLKPGYLGDSEGLAIGADGRIWVSFEGLDRLASYDDPDAPARRQPRPPDLPGMRVNAGLEALAIRDDGSLIALPEKSGRESRPFPVLRFADETWRTMTHLRRDPRWLAVGADFGPDGYLYLLERDFHGLLGFSSRVRRMRLTEDGPRDEEILLETQPLQYDNLEGLSVWHDGQGIRLTLISDDNFLIVQRTELVEYRLRD